MEHFKSKYLKYKKKYINIKNNINHISRLNQKGGSAIIDYIKSFFNFTPEIKPPIIINDNQQEDSETNTIEWSFVSNSVYSLHMFLNDFKRAINKLDFMKFYDVETYHHEQYNKEDDIKIAKNLEKIKIEADEKLKSLEITNSLDENLKKKIMIDTYNSIIPDTIKLETGKINTKIKNTILDYNKDTIDKESVADNNDKKLSNELITSIDDKNDLIENEKKLVKAIAYSIGLSGLADGMNDDKTSNECFLAIKMTLYSAATENITKYIKSTIKN